MRRSIGEMADNVLSNVVDTTKTAAEVIEPQGEIGQALVKVASLLRNEASLKIDYTDIEKFRVTHGV
jgi:hypothetical protein